FGWARFPPEVALEAQPGSPIQPVPSPDGVGGPRNVERSSRSEPPPARASSSRMPPLLTAFTGHRLSQRTLLQATSCSIRRVAFASHGGPQGLRNLQVSSPIARCLSEGPRERKFGDVVCQNAVDHIELSRGHCFLRLHEFHVVGDTGLQFLTNQLEVLFGDLEIVVSTGHLATGRLHIQHCTTDL